MKKIVLAALLLSVAACADDRKFYKSGATLADYNKESYVCERDARSVSYSFGGGLNGALAARDFYRRCMAALGWELR